MFIYFHWLMMTLMEDDDCREGTIWKRCQGRKATNRGFSFLFPNLHEAALHICQRWSGTLNCESTIFSFEGLVFISLTVSATVWLASFKRHSSDLCFSRRLSFTPNISCLSNLFGNLRLDLVIWCTIIAVHNEGPKNYTEVHICRVDLLLWFFSAFFLDFIKLLINLVRTWTWCWTRGTDSLVCICLFTPCVWICGKWLFGRAW